MFEIYQFFDIKNENGNLKHNVFKITNDVLFNKNMIIHYEQKCLIQNNDYDSQDSKASNINIKLIITFIIDSDPSMKMFSNIIIKSLRNKKKIDNFNSISKVKKLKLKSNALMNRTFLFKINKNDNEKSEKKDNFDDERNNENEIEFENIL